MKTKFLVAPLTILFIAASGLVLKYAPQIQAKFIDAEASASKTSLYGSKDYNNFLATFRLDPNDKTFDVVSIHTENDVYVFLVNTKQKGGAALYDNMSAPASSPVSMLIPFDEEDQKYKEHLEATTAFLKGKGYQVTLKPFNQLVFRSMVHAGHFDVVLLEKRALS